MKRDTELCAWCRVNEIPVTRWTSEEYRTEVSDKAVARSVRSWQGFADWPICVPCIARINAKKADWHTVNTAPVEASSQAAADRLTKKGTKPVVVNERTVTISGKPLKPEIERHVNDHVERLSRDLPKLKSAPRSEVCRVEF